MLCLVLCPVLFLLAQDQVQLATADTHEYFMFYLPFMACQLLCTALSYRNVPSPALKRSYQESVFMLFCYVRAVITVMVGIKLGFKVTNKDSDSSAFRKSLNWCLPFIIYYCAAIPAIIFGLNKMYRFYYHAPLSAMIAVGVSLFWVMLTMWQMWPPLSFLLQELRKANQKQRQQKNNKQQHRDGGHVVV